MVYERIKTLRESKNLTQSVLGKYINVTQRTYSYYENGKRTIPPEVLIRLANFHNTSVDYILGMTDNPKPYEATTNP